MGRYPDTLVRITGRDRSPAFRKCNDLGSDAAPVFTLCRWNRFLRSAGFVNRFIDRSLVRFDNLRFCRFASRFERRFQKCEYLTALFCWLPVFEVFDLLMQIIRCFS